jgi:uncharacterized membrane protein YccC
MNTIPSGIKNFAAGLQAYLHRRPAMKVDADAILFSAKCFAAAMLAYYISLRIGLPKPFWAIITVYIVSQTSAGASFSRGVYRFAGTCVGAVATVAIVPNFANDPVLCSVILAGWIGLCLFFSQLDRTPRAYAFVLAGYTASLIGFPSVLDPGALFDTASLRVQEISIGILCTILVHRYVLPRPMTGQFTDKLSAMLQDARRLAGDALTGTLEEKQRDRDQLCVDLLTLRGLATHLPYDPASVTLPRETLHLIHDRLARLLPLTAEIEDRVSFLGIGGGVANDELTALVSDVRAWIAASEVEEDEAAATRLIVRARSVKRLLRPPRCERVDANLAGHLAEMIGQLHDCDRLRQNTNASWRSRTASLHGAKRAKGYVHHRDPWMAARAALGSIVGILSGCAFWIWSGWPDGGMAVSILGVCCTLFGNFDAPVPFVIQYMIGLIYGVLISFVYSFVILPQVTSFAVLVAVLAPAYLLAGSLQARLPTAFMAMGITLTIPILSRLGTNYAGDFAASLNTVVALFAAVGFGAVSMSLFQTVPVDVSIKRLHRMIRRDVGHRAMGGWPNEAHWTSLMIDRAALLQPRLKASRNADPDILGDTLRHLRIGYVAGQLRKAMPQEWGEARTALDELLSSIAACFGGRKPATPADLNGIDQRIETLMAMTVDGGRLRISDLLIDLRFALGSEGMARTGASQL